MQIYRNKKKLLKLVILGGLFYGIGFPVFLGELRKGTIPDAKLFVLWPSFVVAVASWLLNIYLLFARLSTFVMRA